MFGFFGGDLPVWHQTVTSKRKTGGQRPGQRLKRCANNNDEHSIMDVYCTKDSSGEGTTAFTFMAYSCTPIE
ncbi:hypothetical protein PAE9249_05252 [Paenibacillus sp. CECT 9249]|nr:hypothetical protein PAE9249_05252 [Paenibacillus sp. CECT 9249]